MELEGPYCYDGVGVDHNSSCGVSKGVFFDETKVLEIDIATSVTSGQDCQDLRARQADWSKEDVSFLTLESSPESAAFSTFGNKSSMNR